MPPITVTFDVVTFPKGCQPELFGDATTQEESLLEALRSLFMDDASSPAASEWLISNVDDVIGSV